MWKIIFIVMVATLAEGGLVRKWDYSVVSIFTNSSSESEINISLQATRLGRGNLTISGFIDTTIAVGDEFVLSWAAYHSNTGVGEFKKLPYSMTNLSFSDYMNKLYKGYMMESVAGCSNAPQFKGKWRPPVPKGHYYLKDCIINSDGIDFYIYMNYLKFVATVRGPVDLYLEVLVRVSEKH